MKKMYFKKDVKNIKYPDMDYCPKHTKLKVNKLKEIKKKDIKIK